MAMLAPPTERRVHRRVPLDNDVRVTSAGETCVTRTNNVSVGGLSLSELEGVHEGSEVQIELSLGLGRTFVTRAEVMWLRGKAAGVRFLQLDQRALVALIGYVGRAS